MPQLAPIMWLFMFCFIWMTLFVWMILQWFNKKNSFYSVSSAPSSLFSQKAWLW